MAHMSRRRFVAAVGGTTAGLAVGAKLPSLLGKGAVAEAATAPSDTYGQKFLELYKKIKDKSNGYFSTGGVPYHSIETLMVEAPDHGHETTSEAFSFWLWLEAAYGRVTGDFSGFNSAWTTLEKTMIPNKTDQPANASYKASAPATYIPESGNPEDYPGAGDSNVKVGADPIADELKSAYGGPDIYGMHWIIDVDNVYGFGNTIGKCVEEGPSSKGPCWINTFQRGSQESTWETVTQPCIDMFKYGGKYGYLDLFVKDSQPAKQWKYSNAPDADARAVQATYWAWRWANAAGKASSVSESVTKAVKMGDFLRYSMFDKYFKKIGNCTDATSCAAGSGREAQHYLLGWYYAWGGALDNGGWAWRIGDGAAHHGYQNPVCAWALSTVSAFAPKSTSGKSDWAKSLTRQIEFLQWLQSADGAIAGGCTNSWEGHYGKPESKSTFYGMAYDWQPVYHDPPSNNWFGMQTWGMERWMEYYYLSKDSKVKTVLDNWIKWVLSVVTVEGDTFSVPGTLEWSGEPATWSSSGGGGKNTSLKCSVKDSGQDIGVTGALIKALLYYAAATGDTKSQALGKALLDALTKFTDTKGIAAPEVRKDYSRFADKIYIPSGWTGKMPNGDKIDSSSTFLSIRTFYKKDAQWSKVQAYLDGGDPPELTYHRFWAQVEVAVAFAVYSELFASGASASAAAGRI